MGEQGLVREAATTRSRPERIRATHGNSADQSLLRGRKDFSGHLTGAAHGFLSDNTEATPQLDDLAKDVAALDGWYLDYIGKTSPASLGEFVAFTFTDGDKGYMSRAEMISHMVLHAGIHRGRSRVF